MSDFTSFLLFQIKNSKYAIAANTVTEILWLPELTAVSGLPRYFVGIFNYRGDIIPVMDINLRQRKKTYSYKINNKIVVLQLAKQKIAIHISSATKVIGSEHCEFLPLQQVQQQKKSQNTEIITEIIKHDNEIIQKIDIGKLQENDIEIEEPEEEEKSDILEKLLTTIPEEDRHILQARKMSYLKDTDKMQEGLSDLTPVAIICIGEEYFGIELEYIQEFSEVHSLAKVPCTPPHIAGCMNLRGDILTLLDLHYLLFAHATPNPSAGKVVISKNQENMLGLLVRELLDVIYIDKTLTNTSLPMHQDIGKNLIKETFFHTGKVIGVLDIVKLLNEEHLIVNEQIRI
ncbi:MAG: chemotaxis protein CheW [Spirochaetota bacterium]